MCERLALKESIQLLYEQITGQRAHSGEAALREASEACRSVMDALDRARNTISTLLRFVGQEDALDALAESCEQLSEVMFEQGYLLGYERYIGVCLTNTPSVFPGAFALVSRIICFIAHTSAACYNRTHRRWAGAYVMAKS